jgi:hypothetical protein
MGTETTKPILIEFSTINGDGSYFELSQQNFRNLVEELGRGVWRQATNGRYYNPASIVWLKQRG